MRSLIKRILKQYLARQYLKQRIQAAFLSKYQLTDYTYRSSPLIARKLVHQDIENILRIGGNALMRAFQTQALIELGVVPIFSQGYRYFAGIKKL